MPLILAGERRREASATSPPLAQGETTFSYGLSEREAGSDTAAMKCRARQDGDDWVLNGQKSWITNAGVSEYYTVLAVTDPDGPRGQQRHRLRRREVRRGLHLRGEGAQARHQGQPHPRAALRQRAASPATASSARSATASRSPCATLDHTRVTIGAQAVGIAQGALDQAARLRQGAQAVRQAHRRLPGHPVHARRHGDGARGRAPDGLRRGRQVRARRQGPAVLRCGRQVLRLRRRDEGHDGRRAAARRRRLHAATSRSSG